MGIRAEVFNKQFMEENFGKIHMEDETMKARGASLKDLVNGYPDMGNGRYAEKLAYKDWYELNRIQRGHKNFLESLTIIVVLLLVNGMVNPYISIISGAIYFVVRPFYFSKESRYLGYAPSLLITLVLIIGSCHSLSMFVGEA